MNLVKIAIITEKTLTKNSRSSCSMSFLTSRKLMLVTLDIGRAMSAERMKPNAC